MKIKNTPPLPIEAHNLSYLKLAYSEVREYY